MEKGLLRLGKFLIPMFFLLVLMESGIRFIPNAYSIKSSYVQNNGENINTLIVGRSHHFYGLNPDYMPPGTFNMANVSQMYNYDLLILEKYLDELPNIKFIVLPISYHSFYDEGTDMPLINKNYLIYFGTGINNKLWDYFHITSAPFRENSKKIYDIIFKKKSWLSSNELGFGLDFESRAPVSLQESARLAAQRHQVFNPDFNQDNLKKFYQILETSLAKNIQLILVSAPVSQSYYNALDEEVLERIKIFTNSLIREKPHIHYFDFRQHPEFQDEDFYDADHLNHQGAKKFSKALTLKIQDIEQIALETL
jgi:hypothetical protein